MAKFRMVHTEFWADPSVVEEFSPEDKLFFLYLLTNSKTTQVGIYQITKKQMAFDTGYSIESVSAIMDRFINHHQLIKYNADTREIAIKNWGKYNLNRGGKPIIDCVTSELKEVKDQDLIHFVGDRIEKSEIKVLYDSYHVSYNDTSTDTNNDSTYEAHHESNDKKTAESSHSKGSYDTSHDTYNDSPTTRGEEKEEEEYKEEEKEEQQQQYITNDNNGDGGRDSDFKEVIDFYRDNLQVGVTETNFNRELIIQFFEEWNKDMLLGAMKLAAKKEAKGLTFVEAVLNNWKEYGVKTLDDARRYNDQLKRRKSAPGRNNYGKPDITPDWYEKHKEESKHNKKELSEADKEKAAKEADDLLHKYLSENA